MKKVFLCLWSLVVLLTPFCSEAMNRSPSESSLSVQRSAGIGEAVAEKIKTRARSASLRWIDTQVNPEIRDSFRHKVEEAIEEDKAGTLKYTVFTMQAGAFQNKPLFVEQLMDPTGCIENIALLAFSHASDSDDEGAEETKEAAVDILRECCSKVAIEVGIR